MYHTEINGKLQLIPKDIHDAVKHTGGAAVCGTRKQEYSMEIKKFGLSEEEISDLENKQCQKFSKQIKKRYIFLNERQTLSAEKISDLEKLISHNLPIQYKNFIMSNNGGKPDKYILDNEKIINYFFGYFSNPKLDNSIEWHLEMYSKRYPRAMLPIASAGGGDLILLGLSGSYENKVYYWDHNMESETDGTNYYDNVTFIANNLEDFIKLLKDDD